MGNFFGALSVYHRFTYLYPMAAVVICPFPPLATIPAVQDAKVAWITCCSAWKAESCTLHCVLGPFGCQRQLLRQCIDKTTNPLNHPSENPCWPISTKPIEVVRCSRYFPDIFRTRYIFWSIIQANQPTFRLKATSLQRGSPGVKNLDRQDLLGMYTAHIFVVIEDIFILNMHIFCSCSLMRNDMVGL